jgi:hypothetical protein
MFNALNEAQEQPAFEKTTAAIPRRLDLIVMHDLHWLAIIELGS